MPTIDAYSSDTPLEQQGHQRISSRPALKGLLLLILIVAGLALLYLTPLKAVLAHVAQISAWFSEMGLKGSVVFVVAVTALITLGVPRLLLCTIGGMAYGFWTGLLLTQIGTLLGFYLVFMLVRHAGWNFRFLRKRPRLDRLRARIGRGGVLSVFSLRMMPISGMYSSIILGMLQIRHRDFLFGTILGILPEAVPATLIGTGAAQETLRRSIYYAVGAAIIFMASWTGIGMYLKKTRQHRDNGLQDVLEEND